MFPKEQADERLTAALESIAADLHIWRRKVAPTPAELADFHFVSLTPEKEPST